MAYLDNLVLGSTTYDLDNPLFRDELPNTTQEINYGSDGNVQSITHKTGNTTIRTDTFTFNGAVVTETRTLSTGESLAIATNRNTKVTTVTYSAA